MMYIKSLDYSKPVINDNCLTFILQIFIEHLTQYTARYTSRNVMVNNKRTKVIQKEIENVISPVTFKETQAVIKNIPTKKTAGPDSFIRELHQILKEEIMTD